MAGELQKKGIWSDTLPYGQDVIGKGFPAPTGPGGKLGPFVGTEYKIEEGDKSSPEPFSPEFCEGKWYDPQCWLSRGGPLDTSKIAGDVAKAGGDAVIGIAGPWLTKGALLGLGAILLILGLWALMKNGPIVQGVREGIAASRG